MRVEDAIKLMAALVGDSNSSEQSKGSELKTIIKGRYIVLGNRGNTVVGDLSVSGDIGTLTNASVIRRWGTSDGLGQLALSGAQPDTVLDKCGTFEFDVRTTCGMIKVEGDL